MSKVKFPDDTSDLFKDFDDGMIRTTHKPGTYSGFSCYMTHPALKIGDWEVYGGSCGNPIVENADIYVGLDSSMRRAHHYPWNDGPQVTNIFFPIADGNPPKDVAEFKKMIKWLAVQLIAGKLIHVGCIGGHGRTGLVLAALVKEVTGNPDAIQYVRDHYCKKAVESASQVLFLHNEYGINKVESSRNLFPVARHTGHDSYSPGAKWDARTPVTQAGPSKTTRKAPGKAEAPLPLSLRPGLPSGRFEAPAVASITNLWGGGIVVFDKQPKSAKMVATQEGA